MLRRTIVLVKLFLLSGRHVAKDDAYDEWDIDENFILIYSVAELEALDRYLDPYKYDSTADPVVAVCGKYSLGTRIPCALPDHTPHLYGWAGRTRDGFKVAIGGDCATNHIPNIEMMTARAERN